VAVKVAEVQNMARHVLRNALVLWLSGQHLNQPCKSGEATKATGKQKWPTLRNVGIRYSLAAGPCQLNGTACAFTACYSQSMPILRTLSQPAPWQSLFVCGVCLVVCVFMMRVVIPLRLRCLYVAIAGCAPWLPLCYLFPIVTHHHYYSKYFIFYYI
jgi:hypothetical protein